MHDKTLRQLLHRPTNANKYDFGHLLIIGGAPGTVGAPLLAAMAAFRAGAGLVTIASSTAAIDRIEEHALEVMTLRIAEDESVIEAVQTYCAERKVSAIVAGPGLQPPLTALMPPLLSHIAMPVVLDAGALTVFADDHDVLASIGKRTDIIATPHDGEYHKLTGVELSDDPAERATVVTDFAQKMHITIVSKGHHTLVAHADGSVYREQAGNAGLAKAGTGDILSGIIGGLLAQGISAREAAELGVHLHALAGDLAAQDETEAGIIASDLIDLIPKALQQALELEK